MKYLELPFVGRFRTDAEVMFETQKLSVRGLAERFPPGKARWHPKLKRYVKRAGVVLEGVGVVDLVIIWEARGLDRHLTALLSTLKVGIQELIRAWDARWSLEVSQNQKTEPSLKLSMPELCCPASTR